MVSIKIKNNIFKKILFFSLFAFPICALSLVGCTSNGGDASYSSSTTESSYEETKHHGSHYAYLDSNCTENGHQEFWRCDHCGIVFDSEESEEVKTGVWQDASPNPHSFDFKISDKLVIAPKGHDYGSFVYCDEKYHQRTCDVCGYIDKEEHICYHIDEYTTSDSSYDGSRAFDRCSVCSFSSEKDIYYEGPHTYNKTTYKPNGVIRGYDFYKCNEHEDSYLTNFDFSMYEGVTFSQSFRHVITNYAFNSRNYTIEASFSLPNDISGRLGVIVGSFGNEVGSCVNLEINEEGQPRIYITENNQNHDYHFEKDIRKDGIINLAITLESENKATLFLDGVKIEEIEISYVPNIGKKLVIGGDNRADNAEYFKGRLYSVAIFNDVRTQREMVNDIVLADTQDSAYAISYNLIDETSFNDRVDPEHDPFINADVSTADELEYHCLIGTKNIRVIDDIVLDRTIYPIGKINIFSDENHTIKRDPTFKGDLFVIGENEYGRNLALDGIECETTFGKNGALGTLSIDGNKSMIDPNTKVNGTIAYISYGAIVNLREGAEFVNNIKNDNYRSYAIYDATKSRVMGGAAVIVISGSFNMYGGNVSNCEVSQTQGESTSQNYRLSSYGGAIFNMANFNMYGGEITNNTALYGGAVANYGYVNIEEGTISDNTSVAAGGAIYNIGDKFSQVYIGKKDVTHEVYKVIFEHNVSTGSAGGAIYSGVMCNTVINGATKFVNNTASGSGGAITAKGYLGVNENTLFDNNVSSTQGGALSIDYDDTVALDRRECLIEDAIFYQNRSPKGGAVSTLGGDITFKDCIFEDNKATSTHGGAVYQYYLTNSSTSQETGSKTVFDNCYFENNESVTGKGGAIFIDRLCKSTVINGSSFINNKSTNDNGGAICSHGATLLISDASFDGNTGVNGGAIYASYRTKQNANANDIIYDSTIRLSNCNFENNVSNGDGGAIYFLAKDDSHDESYRGAIIADCSFISNKSLKETIVEEVVTDRTGNGGALYICDAVVDINNSLFEDNLSGKNGGAIAMYSSIVDIKNITASNNYAYDKGGFAYLSGNSECEINKDSNTPNTNSINQNHSVNGGGAIYINTNSLLDVNHTNFENNGSNHSGGAIYLFSESSGTFANCNFTSNTASNGGAIISYGGDLNIVSSSFAYNKCEENGYGGAIYARVGATTDIVPELSISSCAFTNNNADKGGAIFFNNGLTCELNDCDFIHNGFTINPDDSVTKASEGGAIYITKSSITINGGTYDGNVSSGNGGILYITNNSQVSINSGLFISNESEGNGNFYVNASTLNINSNQIGDILFGTIDDANNPENKGNKAALGGVIYSESTSIININKAVFGYNSNTSTSSSYGGAIYVLGSTTLNVSDSLFKHNNSLSSGGAIGANGYATLTIINSEFESNSATSYGGAIYVTGNTETTLSICSFISNSATSYGAVGAGSGSTVLIQGCAFENNSAASYGGAIGAMSSSSMTVNDYIDAINNQIIHSTFISNNASVGGAIRISDNANGVFTNAVFTSNGTNNDKTTTEGGVIYINSTSTEGAVFNGCSFTSNKASKGGVVNSNASITVFNNCIFSNNSSTSDGAVMYLAAGSETIIHNGTCTGNVSNGNGVFYVNRSTLDIDTQGEGQIVFGTIESNEADDKGNKAVQGGVVYATVGAVVNIDNATFGFNTSTGSSSYGGAIYATGTKNTDDDGSMVTITNSIFIHNNSNSSGGAIGGNGDATIVITNCEFTSNTAASYGGAVYVTGNTQANISDSTFMYNTGNNAGAVGTGSKSTLAVTNCTFNSNTANTNGGALFASTTSTSRIVINNSVISSNTANEGGGLYANNAKVTINNTEFNTNNAISTTDVCGGGDIEGVGAAQLYINGCLFDSDATSLNSKNGGAILVKGTSILTISDYVNPNDNTDIKHTIFRNHRSTNGGAILIAGASNVTVTNVVFSDNVGTNKAGAVLINSDATGTISFIGCSFISNEAGASGGGAMRIEGGSTFSASNCIFESNVSSANAGAIHSYTNGNSTTTFVGCTFDSNSSGTNGGAIYHSNASKLILVDSTFVDNDSYTSTTTSTKGSAIYATAGSDNTVTISGSYVTSNNGIHTNSSKAVITIHTHGLDDLDRDHASDTWSHFVTKGSGVSEGAIVYIDD